MAHSLFPVKIIITCEHGGNHVPAAYTHLFSGCKKILNTHQGYDKGAFYVAKTLAKITADYFLFAKTSQLLVDLNRSVHHPKLFSNITKPCNPLIKKEIIDRYYLPYRTNICDTISAYLSQGYRVLHLSVHSFTPNFCGKIRRNDLGLLYHPQHKMEKKFCNSWKETLLTAGFNQVRLNYPYLGRADGFTQYLRSHFSQKKYYGIELETNQKLWTSERDKKELTTLIVQAFKQTIEINFQQR